MKHFRITLPLVILALLIGFDTTLFSRGIFNLFNDTEMNEEGLKKAIEFDPDTELLYLPKYTAEKELFKAAADLSICRQADVRKYIYIYLTSGREYTKRAITRSGKHLPVIEKIFRQNKDIPGELALLPLLESGFSPGAVSRSGATGIWQFMEGTGNALGLKKNRFADERRSVEKSTDAAVRHLRHLYGFYGNWELALAAYNAGSGHVNRALESSKTTDYWSLRERGPLSQETVEYVPRFIALYLIYKNRALFGIEGEIEALKPQKTAELKLKRQTSLDQISALSGMTVEEIRSLNPELGGSLTPDYKEGYTLKLAFSALKIYNRSALISRL